MAATRIRTTALLLCLALPVLSSAQEVQWRQDYLTARREASAKNRILVIDFSTDSCWFCKKLDATTFKEPEIVAALNDQCVPLKIDAQRDPHNLTDKLRIQTFPTIVFATAEGKILEIVPGYQEAGAFQERLKRALGGPPTPPDWMTRDYEAAGQAIAAADYTRALALLRAVVEDGKDRPVQIKARQLLQELEQQAAGRLARIKKLVAVGQNSEAKENTTELIRVFSGTQAAVEASRMLTSLNVASEERNSERTKKARELLNQAREDLRTQQYLTCLNRCELLINAYADLPEGAEALQISSEIRNNSEWLRMACETMSDQLSSMYLSLAEAYLQKGQPQQAIVALERVIQSFPGTRQAESALLRLSQIQGQPTRPGELKK